jgi:outer membrane receptor protein involved in Fe transport
MKYLIAAALCIAASAFAQVTPPVVTDTNYAPAEDRSSVGAVLLEENMVIAQRRAFGTRSTPQQVAAIGRGVMQATIAAAKAQDNGPDTRALGGPPATKWRPNVRPEPSLP